MDININISGGDNIAAAIVGLAETLACLNGTSAIMPSDKAPALAGAVQPATESKSIPASEKPLSGTPVTPAKAKAINQIIATPSAAETVQPKEAAAVDPEAVITADKLPDVRQQVADAMKAGTCTHDALKEWLDAHQTERVTLVRNKDLPDLLAFLKGAK